MTIQEFHTGMKTHFGIKNPEHYIDKTMALFNKVALDVFVFDMWLHEKFGEYETKQGMSMSDIVKANFTTDALAFVLKSINAG